MKLLYVPVAICVCLFICRLGQDPLEMLLKLGHAADVKVTEMHQCEWEHGGMLKECQYMMSYWHAGQGNKMGVMSSWQYYVQIWGACASFALTTLMKQEADKVETVGSLFSVAIMSEYSYATWTNKMHIFQINTLIQFFNFWHLLHVLNLVGSFSGWFETCSRHQKWKNWIKIFIWKVRISLVHVA